MIISVRARLMVAFLAVAAVVLGPLAVAPPVASAAADSTIGAAGLGDRLYPTLGNGGYDALSYDLDLRYLTAAPSQGIDGTLTMTARATQRLSRFDLDFGGDGVGTVQVNGRPAGFARVGDELVITPGHVLVQGSTFTVRIARFRSRPGVPSSDHFLSTAFFYTRDGSALSGQPNLMHRVFPCNDHPRDKASFTFHLDVPATQTAVANGELTSKQTRGSRTRWTYVQREPMATELVQVAVGTYTVLDRAAAGAVAVRDVIPTRLLSTYASKLAVVSSQLTWMQSKVGDYPFGVYGSLVVDADLGFALETQTLSLYDNSFFDGNSPQAQWDPVMLHELSHQWFGDSVAPYAWSDLWQNEGHATWYQLTYAAEKGFLAQSAGASTLDELMQDIYAQGDQWRHDDGPVARPSSGDPGALFNRNVYYGGALVLYALRQRIGTAAFDRVERAWVNDYRDRSASTGQFIALAAQVSGDAGVDAFLRDWLYGTTTPAMPGHPTWTVDPVQARRAARTKVATNNRSAGRRPTLLLSSG